MRRARCRIYSSRISCDFSKHEHELRSPAPGRAAKILVPTLAAVVAAFRWPAPQAAAAAPRWFAAAASPPPLGGWALLAFACTLEV